MRLFRKIADTFLFGNIFVAICAYFLTLQDFYFLGKVALINPLALFVFFSTLFVYNYRKFFFASKDLTPPFTQRGAWVFKNRHILGFLTAFALIGILLTFWRLSMPTLLLLGPCFLLSIAYASNLSNNKFSNWRLRQIPFLKIFLVAIVWTLVTVVLPILETDFQSIFSIKTAFSCLTRFLFIFAITIPFDVRDIAIDRNNLIKTLPTAFGEKKSILLACCVLLVFSMINIWSLEFVIENEHSMAIGKAISGIISLIFVSQSSATSSDQYVSFWLEGLMIQQFILIGMLQYI